MSTVRDLIKGSMRLLGAIATGETPSADEQAEGLTALNEMVESWSTEGLIIHTKARETFSLVAGQQNYTMGPGGDFDTTRPLRIEYAASVSSEGAETPIEILTLAQWADVAIKSTQSTLPTKLYPAGTAPLETLSFYPVPSAVKTVALYSWKPLSSFASVSATVELPPGYYRALRYNLAIELAPEYGKAVSNEIASIASEAKANIKRMNIKPVFVSVDPALTGGRRLRSDIFSGE